MQMYIGGRYFERQRSHSKITRRGPYILKQRTVLVALVHGAAVLGCACRHGAC